MGILKKLFNKSCKNVSNKHSSVDNGKRYENNVLRYLRKEVIITDKNKVYSYGNRIRHVEIDIETPSTAIEVKSGKSSGLKRQLDRYSDVTKKEPVALAPNMRYEAKKQTRNSYKVFDSKEELKGYLLSKGDGKKKRRR